MERTFLFFALLVTLTAPRLFSASSITYAKDSSVDSINLDLKIIDVFHRKDGALVARAAGVVENMPVQLKIVISAHWKRWDRGAGGTTKSMQAETEILADGGDSSRLDELLRQSFASSTSASFFCSTYVAITISPRRDLERRRIKFLLSDHGLCGSHEIQIAFDLPRRSMELVIFEPTGGGAYRDRIDEVFEHRANQSLEPTSPAVTPRADARVAPAGDVGHL